MSSHASPTRSGPHLILLAVYAVFVLAAGARSIVQLLTRFDEAPVAYLLSFVAACTYLAGWFAIRRAATGRPAFARVMLWVELIGVLVVGTLSLVDAELFPDDTVWSAYGMGYGWVPLVLPIIGLFWLARSRLTSPTDEPDEPTDKKVA